MTGVVAHHSKSLQKQAEAGEQQLKILSTQLHDDHERSRLRTAVDLVIRWSENLDRATSSARKLGEKLTFEQAKKLYDSVPFELDHENANLVAICMSKAKVPFSPPTTTNEHFILNPTQSAALRWQVIGYLNKLEGVMLAAQHNVADATIIHKEFEYLLDMREGQTALLNFRMAAGIQNYPAILNFQKKKKQIDGSPPLG